MAFNTKSIENNIILLRKASTDDHNLLFERIVTTGHTVYPGMFVQPRGTDIDGAENTTYGVTQAGDEYGWRPRAIAIVNEYWGKTMDDPYTAGEKIFIRLLQPGDVVLTKILSATFGIHENQQLTYDSSGWLREWVLGTDPYPPIATPLETDLTPTLPRWTPVLII